MNCKQFIMVLLMGIFLLGGPANIHADTNNSPQCEDKSVAACLNENSEETPEKNKNTVTTPEPASDTTTFGTMMKVLFALVFVVGLMVLILKLLHKRTQVVQQGRGIQTLGGAMLGNQRSVQLVKVGSRVLVVGVGENVELIKEIEDESEIASLLESTDTSKFASETRSGISHWLSSLLTNDRNNGERNSFQKLLKTQLNEAKKDRSKLLESIKKKGQNND